MAPRTYLGGSRLGHPCERALQFEYAQAPKDEGAAFDGRTLRIFAIGHALEDLAAAWLRGAGFDLYTRKGNRPDGGQFGFSVAGGRIRGHVDGILADGPTLPGLGYPALWECKTMNARSWRETAQKGVVTSKPVYAAQLAVYQAYTESSVAGISTNPALFTAVNKDTARAAPRTGAVRRRPGAADERPRSAHPAGDRGRRTAAAHRRQPRSSRMPVMRLVAARWSLPA